MKHLYGFLLSGLFPLIAKSEINIGYTVEWLAHLSDVIVVATPQEVDNFRGPGEVHFTKVRFKIEENIKGPALKEDLVTVHDFSYKEYDKAKLEEAKAIKKKLLVFAHIGENYFREINGKYVLTQTQTFKSVFDATKAPENLFNTDFKVVKDYDSVLNKAKIQTEKEKNFRKVYPTGKIKRKSLHVPSESEAFRKLWSGSSCYLSVPEYVKR